MIASIRPGLLVSLHTRISGGISYGRRDLDAPAELGGEGAEVRRWETTRVVEDPIEHAAAKAARAAAQTAVTRTCVRSDFGLLCPAANEAALDAGIAAARAIAAQFNADARRARVEVYVLKGRVASTDEEAVRALSAEVRDLLGAMETGIRGGNVEEIREAASRARRLGSMLEEETGVKIAAAVAEARAAAREIVKRAEKDGALAADAASEIKLDAIATARFAFLDLDAPAPATSTDDAMPAADLGRAAGLDLDDAHAAPAPAAGEQ